MVLDTDRLFLRPIQPEDVPSLVAMWTDPDVTRYMGGPRDETFLRETFEADLLDPAPPNYDLWPVLEKVSDVLVGYCGLLDKEVDGEKEIELVYVFHKFAWGQGYATEIGRALKSHAFTHMNLPRIISLIQPDNAASERVARKIGMRLEREISRPGGEVRRVYVAEAAAE